MASDIQRFLLEKSRDLDALANTFGSYSSGITRPNIDSFINQFTPEHYEVALKVLQNIDYYDGPRITTLARNLGGRIRSLTNNNLDDVLMCAVKPVYGTSTESIQRKLRQTLSRNAAERQVISQKFIKFSDFESLSENTNNLSIFFVDDFIGSGDTIISSWGRVQIYENENHSYYVGVLVAYTDAIQRIEEETAYHFEIVSARELAPTMRIFNPNNTLFTEEEKQILKKYCEILPNKKEHRYGHRDGQSLVIFSEMAPNNSLPILHQRSDDWIPLFPRYF